MSFVISPRVSRYTLAHSQDVAPRTTMQLGVDSYNTKSLEYEAPVFTNSAVFSYRPTLSKASELEVLGPESPRAALEALH